MKLAIVLSKAENLDVNQNRNLQVLAVVLNIALVNSVCRYRFGEFSPQIFLFRWLETTDLKWIKKTSIDS